MKATLSTLFAAALFCAALTSNAQAFQKGNMNVDVGLGYGLYSTKTTTTFVWLGQTFSDSDDDGAGSVMVPITFEYGISNKLGIGAELAFSNYFIDEDDSTNVTDQVKGTDFSVFLQYHFLESDKNDLLLGLSVGGSGVKWDFEDGGELSGSGSKFSLYLKDRIFFNDHVGLMFQAGFVSYNYNKIDTSDENVFIESIDWKLSGVHLGTGLSVKF